MSVKQESYCITAGWATDIEIFDKTLDTVTAGFIRDGFILPVEIPIDCAIRIPICWECQLRILIDGAIGKCRIRAI
jgi:hypothetical protein